MSTFLKKHVLFRGSFFRLILMVSCLPLSFQGHAGAAQKDRLSIGIIENSSTGLSVQGQTWYEPIRWHLVAYFEKRQFAQVHSDFQWFYPKSYSFFSLVTGRLYAGLGLKKISYAGQEELSSTWGRIPLGGEWSLDGETSEIFAEMTAFIGPFPKVKLKWVPSAGLRYIL